MRLALLGAAATAFQVLLSRAFLAAFGGNEAVLAALRGRRDPKARVGIEVLLEVGEA